jgi:cell division protein FtsQ
MRPLGPAQRPSAPQHGASAPSPRQKRDPAPSVMAYRFQRLWLTPVFRVFMRYGLPLIIIVGGSAAYLSNPRNMHQLTAQVEDLRRTIEARPEFRVTLLSVNGASPALADEIRGRLSLDFPLSSFDLDLPQIKAQIEEMPAVRNAQLRIAADGVLQLDIEERLPELIWQTREAFLLIDGDGVVIDDLISRPISQALPLIGGEGADLAAREALNLVRIAAPLADQLRGFVRVGERRWDVILSDGRKIMLPEENASFVLDRVIALDQAQDILSRDILSIDMRRPDRPTLRLSAGAKDNFDMLRGQLVVSGERQG